MSDTSLVRLAKQAVLELRNAAQLIDEKMSDQCLRSPDAEDWRALADRIERVVKEQS